MRREGLNEKFPGTDERKKGHNLVKGVDAVAHTLMNSSDRLYGVPGYPITGLLEKTGAEVVINEKVGVEYALGDSLSGKRSCVILKNVGLNACADPFIEATTQGVLSGVVIVAGDDPDATGSQNAQDSRYYGELAEVPVIEPGPWNVGAATEEAFRASERFSRITILRLTPSLLEGMVTDGITGRIDGHGTIAPGSLTMKGRVDTARNKLSSMVAWSETSGLNTFDGPCVVVGGAEMNGYPGSEEKVSRLGIVYPPPVRNSVSGGVRELGRPFVREHRYYKAPEQVTPDSHAKRGYFRSFCKECPFIPAIRVLDEKGLPVICDAGCCVLCMNPPYSVGLVSYGMGSSVAVAARSTRIALTGDYALLHSGIPALIDVYEKKSPLLCIVMKNNCMGMTGGQRAYDINPYLSWARPVTCMADDETRLRDLLVFPEEPVTLIIEGICPEGRHHETVEC